MKLMGVVVRATFLVVALSVGASTTALSQGRSSGHSRNPEETKRTEVAPAPNPSPGRDVGRTRQQETPQPAPVPPVSDGGNRSRGGHPSSGSGHESPPPKIERQPVYRQPQHDSPTLPPPPPPGNCGDGIDVGGRLPIPAPGGFWIRGGINFGRNVTLCDSRTMPEYSGYDFSDLLKRPYDDPFTDMAVETDSWGDLSMVVRDDTEIMDLGIVQVAIDVIFVPARGWSPNRSVRLEDGYEYVVRTWDGHYAKFVVTGLLRNQVTFDWAYQYEEPAGAYPAMAPVRQEGFMRFAR